MITNTSVLKAMVSDFEPRYFISKYAGIVGQWAVEYFHKYGEAPGAAITDIYAQKRKAGACGGDPELIAEFLSALQEKYGDREINEAHLVDMSNVFFNEQRLKALSQDLSQHLEAGNLAGALETINKFQAKKAGGRGMAPGYTATELLQANFPEPAWVVPGLFIAGLNPLGGPPKVGKSWFALNLSISIATGEPFLGRYAVEPGEVLYLDFELQDTKIKNRLQKCLGDRQDRPGLENLHIYPKGSWSRIHQGGIEMLGDFAQAHQDLKLVVIDVWNRFDRPRTAKEENSYSTVYEAVGPLSDFAHKHNLMVLVIHHLSKGWRQYDSPLAAFLGSTALPGAGDNLFALVKGQGEADGVLWATGRDIEETRLALEWGKGDCTWRYLGQADEFELTQDQAAIIQAIADNGEAMSPKDIAAAIGKKEEATRQMLIRMVKQERLSKEGYGKYIINNNHSSYGKYIINSNHTSHSSYTSNTSHSSHSSLEPERVTTVTYCDMVNNNNLPLENPINIGDSESVTTVTSVTSNSNNLPLENPMNTGDLESVTSVTSFTSNSKLDWYNSATLAAGLEEVHKLSWRNRDER